MSALNKMRSAGFTVELNGENLKIAPSSKLTDKQRDFIKAHKADLIAELAAVDAMLESASDPVTTAAIRYLDGIGETDHATRLWFLANLTPERIALFAEPEPNQQLAAGGKFQGQQRHAACCDRCAVFQRNPMNPTGGLGHCDHLDRGRMTLPPLSLRDCAQYRPRRKKTL